MATGLPDLVDCAQAADEAAVMERVYELRDLPRLKDYLAVPDGVVQARFEFADLGSGRIGAHVTVEATPAVVCQRCLQAFALPIDGGSEIEFATGESRADVPLDDSERELVEMKHGLASLRELAEEEMLLALPIAPACDTPLTCGKAPSCASGQRDESDGEVRRPFSGLQDLLKKT